VVVVVVAACGLPSAVKSMRKKEPNEVGNALSHTGGQWWPSAFFLLLLRMDPGDTRSQWVLWYYPYCHQMAQIVRANTDEIGSRIRLKTFDRLDTPDGMCGVGKAYEKEEEKERKKVK
jgi:hypothetical protein